MTARTLIVLLLLLVPGAGLALETEVRFPVRTMGTEAQLVLVGEANTLVTPAEAAGNTLRGVDALMSNWTETSEVARINRTAGTEPVTVDPQVGFVLEHALRIGAASGGAFDITVEPLVRAWGFLGGTPQVPERERIESLREHVGLGNLEYDAATRTLRFVDPETRIDLGGIAKGFAVDAAVATLRKQGVENALVDLSGNMYAMGKPVWRDAWTLGVRDPRDRIPYFAKVTLEDEAVATSGGYEQFVTEDGHTYGHILDPRTGWPAEGPIAVTVFAATAIEADAWGTALFAMDPAAARALVAADDDLHAILVVPGGKKDQVWVERSLRERFVMEKKAEALFEIVWF